MSFSINRRQLLAGAAAISASALMPWATRLWADAPEDVSQREIHDFLMLSEQLTGKSQLNAKIAGRAYQGLLSLSDEFPQQMRQLIEALKSAEITDMRQFKTFAAQQPDAVVKTAIDIISAWYLGYTGTIDGNLNRNTAQFVTYTGALMYRPTLDATVIPTYSRGHTNYWESPPATIATD